MSSDPRAPSEAPPQSGASEPQPKQMEASELRRRPRTGQAAFGTSSGAAVTFRDYASI